MSDGKVVPLPGGKTMNVPQYVSVLLEKLNTAGYEAFCVGGCVRDSMLGILPHDYDICTNAETHEIKAVFSDFKTIDTGIKHGTVTVVSDSFPVEITTYRADGEYEDHRHPSEVIFTKCIDDDLQRRDFTVNAMAVSITGEFRQADGGNSDLENGIIKCVGNPHQRFEEDALRILRAMRFAARFGFEFEADTFNAMHEKKHLLGYVSPERIYSELSGLLTVSDGKRTADVLRKCRDIIAVVIPELRPCFDCCQRSPHHAFDVWEHILQALSVSEPDLIIRWSVLLHDICKPYFMVIGTNGRGHFPKHDFYGAEFVGDILKRLKAPGVIIESVSQVVLLHDMRFKPGKKVAAHMLSACGEELTKKLLHVMKCDVTAQSDYNQEEKLNAIQQLLIFVNELTEGKCCYRINDLDINGNIIADMGIPRGPMIKKALSELLDAVIDGKVKNEEAELRLYLQNNKCY